MQTEFTGGQDTEANGTHRQTGLDTQVHRTRRQTGHKGTEITGGHDTQADMTHRQTGLRGRQETQADRTKKASSTHGQPGNTGRQKTQVDRKHTETGHTAAWVSSFTFLPDRRAVSLTISWTLDSLSGHQGDDLFDQ
jgi:hypothetical protein